MTEASKNPSATLKVLQNKPAPLGRGLSALFGDSDAGYQPPPAPAALRPAATERGGTGNRQLPVTWLQPGKFQPRKFFDQTSLDELADSIREHGVLQPLLVRPIGTEKYEIIAGERRWRAAQAAGVHEVPVVVRELSDEKALEISIIENIQRQDISALEEADAYQRLIAEFHYTQEKLAKIIGKSRSHIANTMRLSNLPDNVKALLNEGAISAGHARALLVAEDPLGLAQEIIRDKLSVREVEARVRKPVPEADHQSLVAELANATTTSHVRQSTIVTTLDANTLALERDLTNALGLKVNLNAHSDGSGAITIAYKTLDQLEDLLQKLR